MLLNRVLQQRWIGRAAKGDNHLLPWPPRSPDLTPCDFFLWGFVKDSVYVPPYVPQETSWSDNACTADHYSAHSTPSLGWIWLPCGCVSCGPGCTHWRILINTWETGTVAAADGVRFARVRWEINFLLTFETAPFFCKHPVYILHKYVSLDIYVLYKAAVRGANHYPI